MVGLCRLCASLKKPDLLITIKDQSNEICQKLQKCCQLYINLQDLLPKSVCVHCVESLNICYKFYNKVQEAQEILQELFPTTQPSDNLKDNTKTLKTDIALEELLPHDDNVEAHEVKKVPTVRSKRARKSNSSSRNIKLEIDPASEKDLENEDLFTIKNAASTTEDADNEGYLREVYNILGMAKNDEDNARTTSKEDICMDISFESPDKEVMPAEKQADEDSDKQNIEEEENEEKTDTNVQVNEFILGGTEHVYVECDGEDANYENEDEENEQGEDTLDLKKEYSTLPPELQISTWNSYIYLCYACEYESPSFMDFFEHATCAHSLSDVNHLQLKCYDCQRIFSHYSAFLNHVRLRHHPALKLKCDACDLLCADYQQYEYHRKMDCSQARKFPLLFCCCHCCKSYHSLYGLQLHVKYLHTEQQTEDNKETFQCKVCKKEFALKRTLKSHEIIHTRKRNIACEICNKLFFSKNSLESHLYSHVAEKLYKCHICQKSFKSDLILKKHQFLHSNVKPFSCRYCERSFRTKIEQTTHERVHTGEMPLQCNHCEKRFRFRSALNAHLKVHSGVKAHACKYCPKSFIDMSNFKKHVKRKHSEEELGI